jgi:hypothetical protein
MCRPPASTPGNRSGVEQDASLSPHYSPSDVARKLSAQTLGEARAREVTVWTLATFPILAGNTTTLATLGGMGSLGGAFRACAIESRGARDVAPPPGAAHRQAPAIHRAPCKVCELSSCLLAMQSNRAVVWVMSRQFLKTHQNRTRSERRSRMGTVPNVAHIPQQHTIVPRWKYLQGRTPIPPTSTNPERARDWRALRGRRRSCRSPMQWRPTRAACVGFESRAQHGPPEASQTPGA